MEAGKAPIMLLIHLLEAAKFASLKKRKVSLEDEERAECLKADAVWHPSNRNEPVSAVWKSKNKDGKFTYVTNTHRCFQTAPTLKGAIKLFHTVVKATS